MRFDITQDRSYFILGATIAAGRSFWLLNQESNKYFKPVTLSNDGTVLSLHRGVNSGKPMDRESVV